MNFINFIDASLLPWVLVMILAGQCLKRFSLPKWLPPMPVIIFILSFFVCSLFGCAECSYEGWRGFVLGILKYGIGNGLAITMISCYGYDLVHSVTKKVVSVKEKKIE